MASPVRSALTWASTSALSTSCSVSQSVCSDGWPPGCGGASTRCVCASTSRAKASSNAPSLRLSSNCAASRPSRSRAPRAASAAMPRLSTQRAAACRAASSNRCSAPCSAAGLGGRGTFIASGFGIGGARAPARAPLPPAGDIGRVCRRLQRRLPVDLQGCVAPHRGARLTCAVRHGSRAAAARPPAARPVPAAGSAGATG